MRNVLFVCTGNSARSIMAESYMNAAGADNWRAYSAGSKPTGAPNPLAVETLRNHDVPVGEGGNTPRSKSWDEFAGKDAPIMDVVITVCDNAAGETCPVWPTTSSGAPHKLHWGFPDPVSAKGTNEEKLAAFSKVFADIRTRIDAFLEETR